ncbi:MAG TPA: hypothetical protein PLP39_04840 [Flavobacterium lutivivi]|nr:hypothetical protein [Flavobacterium lutivivi]
MKNYLYTVTLSLTFIILLGCERKQKNQSAKNLNKESFIGSLRKNSTKVEISYYVNFMKSKIQLVSQPYATQKALLDSIDRFFGKQIYNECQLAKAIIPDGEIRFYSNEKYLSTIQFVIEGNCSGFYTDFSQNPKKFEITEYGKMILTKNKPNN